MERKNVNSSNLRSVGYDESNGILEIQFRTNKTYQYLGVPKSIFIGLLSAASKGKYHHRMIKGKFSYRRS